MRRKSILLTSGLLFLCGAMASARITDEDIYKRYNLPITDREMVLASIGQWQQQIMQDNLEEATLSHGQYVIRAHLVKQWLDFRYIEVDAGLSREWYKKIHAMLDFMAKSKDYLKISKNLRKTNRPGYHKTIENFDKAREMFAELLKKPEKADAESLKKLQAEKKQWLDKAREQMEAEAARRARQ